MDLNQQTKSTMAVKCNVFNMDCREYLASPFCPDFDFAFFDPPFNIGQDYNGFNDRMGNSEYRDLLSDTMRLAWLRLKPGAAMYWHGSVEVSFEFIRVIDRLELTDAVERKLIWGFNFGQNQYNNFTNTHAEIFVLRKPGIRKFYFENVKIPSKRLLQGDKRTETAKHGGFVTPGSIWGLQTNDQNVVVEPIECEYKWGRVVGNSPERRQGHPNQLPEVYIQRAIAANTAPLDLVFDGFAGSGTTGVVATALGRNSILTDISPWNCDSIIQRLEIGAML